MTPHYGMCRRVIVVDHGTQIGHCKIVRVLGSDGMEAVYLAAHAKLRSEVAIKVLPERLRSHQQRHHRLRREAEAAASLKHNNIAPMNALEDVGDSVRDFPNTAFSTQVRNVSS